MGALDALQDLGLIGHQDAQWLRDGHRFLARMRDRLYLLRQRDVDVVPAATERLELVARSLGYVRGGWQELEEDRRRFARHVRQVTDRLFYGAEPTTQPHGPW
jgi:[glutamine synthetase] adenylyltransferase / [glutamine synthetase]-adenylyl-L-tyrosine phosphorylase